MSARETHLPWRDLIGTWVGILGLSPADFWEATPYELEAAEAGYLEMLKARTDDR